LLADVLGRFAFKMEEVSKDGAGGEASTFESSVSKALGSRCP
jgi:hypothetical protein